MAVKQGDDRSFNDYWTELKDYEAMLGDLSDRDKYLRMREGMNSDLKKAMLVFTGIPYEQFAAAAARIDPSLMKARKEKQAKEGKRTRPRIRRSLWSAKARSGTPQQSSGARYRPTSGSKRSASAKKARLSRN